MSNIAVAGLLILGTALMALATVGLWRMPDIYTRISTATKASTLGVGCLLVAVTIFFPETAVKSRALAVLLFILLTAPVSAHMLGRAAYFSGIPLWPGSHPDELHGRYDKASRTLRSAPLEESEGERDY